MTKARSEYIYKITGIIQTRTLHQAPPMSKYAGQAYYKLKIIHPHQPNKTIQVFQNKLESSQVGETLQAGQCFQKKYLFFCRNIRGYYHLINMEEAN